MMAGMRHKGWVAAGVVVAAIVALLVANAVHQQRARDVRVDTLYCTLSGAGPLDRGELTGRLCADLLRDAGIG